MPTKVEATIEDLYHVPEDAKAEIVEGELRIISPAGDFPSRAGGEIAVSLHAFEKCTGARGRAYCANAAFVVNLPNRRSFSPDAAFYIGPRTRRQVSGGCSLPWKCEAKRTTVRLANANWPPSAAIILPPARWWFGTSMCCKMN